jgi:hypothetical protein
VIGSIAVDEALLALKIAFLVALYVFIWLVVRSATRDVKTAPQESIVLSAAEASELRTRLGQQEQPAVKLVVLSSPALPEGRHLELSQAVTVGRAPESDLRLDRDEYVSSRHAKITPAANGTWVEDLGSTNGTYVNGAPVSSARLLQRGDVIRIGDTQLRVEP